MIKSIHLITYQSGGAGIACRRLVDSINSIHVGSANYLYSSYSENGLSTLKKIKNNLNLILDTLYFSINISKPKYRFSFSTSYFGNDISKHKLIQNADIIHIHWINHGFLSIENLEQLFSLGKPIVWTMHDMWAFTGGCHYASECINFESQCGNCFYLRNPNSHDLSYQGWVRKSKLFKFANKISFIGCSTWMAKKAKESSLLKNFLITSIPNPIDTNIFMPVQNHILKKSLNIDENVKIILFGAANINDERKGFLYLTNALKILKSLSKQNNIEIVLFGKNKNFDSTIFPYPVHNLSIIDSTEKMVEVYNLADVFVLPSIQDNLPNMIMESLSCGVPVVAFNNGGIPDMIDHKNNGYLAEYLSDADLAEGINWVLNHPNPEILKSNSRVKVEAEFDNKIVAGKYVDFYKDLLL